MTSTSRLGLTTAEVQERIEQGLTNKQDDSSSRSLLNIVRNNLFTLFNAIVGGSFLALLVLGQWKDALFGIAVLLNIGIGIFQEYRSKVTLDRISLLHAPHSRALRDGEVVELKLEEIVQDDVLLITAGDQLLADAVVLESEGLELDESVLTGESEPVEKNLKYEVLASSVVVAGRGVVQVVKVGKNTYASKITSEAKKFSVVSSELRESINKVIKWISWALLPFVLIAVNGQMQAHGGWVYSFNHNLWQEAVVSSIASVIAFVPQGLVLLTSITFAVAAMGLARKNVLLQELAAVEGLARVDVVCFDKTGTLTEGEIEFDALKTLTKHPSTEHALAHFAHDLNANATARSMKEKFAKKQELTELHAVPFNSARKWSSFTLEHNKEEQTWVLGAPEFITSDKVILEEAKNLAATGTRTLLLTASDAKIKDEKLPTKQTPIALLTFKEKVRSDAADTVNFFKTQGVSIRIISGDNPQTVTAVAKRAGVEFDGEGFDARNLPEDIELLAEIMEKTFVFGRVTPEQKRNMVAALQLRGHTVAMTGDGVNDALALKKADMGIAMGSGSPATKAVSNLVLLDGKFSTLPSVVGEGRRVIANIERVSKLFLTKTVWALTLALTFGILAWRFPFLPRQLSGIDAFSIGLPAFALALLPNAQRYQPGFLKRALKFVVPAGLIVATGVVILNAVLRTAATTQSQTATMLLMGITGIWVLSTLVRPLDKIKWSIFLGMILLGVLFFTVPLATAYFGFTALTSTQFLIIGATAIPTCVAIELVSRIL